MLMLILEEHLAIKNLEIIAKLLMTLNRQKH
jgi:hypothetical protein